MGPRDDGLVSSGGWEAGPPTACVKVLLGQSGRGGTRGGAGKAAQEVVTGIFVFCTSVRRKRNVCM